MRVASTALVGRCVQRPRHIVGASFSFDSLESVVRCQSGRHVTTYTPSLLGTCKVAIADNNLLSLLLSFFTVCWGAMNVYVP